MALQVPFIHTQGDVKVLNKYYSDSLVARVSLLGKDLPKELPTGTKLWMDPSIDIYHNWPPESSSDKAFYLKIDPDAMLGDAAFRKKPNTELVDDIVERMLNKCYMFHPAWTSIPQLPWISGESRKRVNQRLVRSAIRWKYEQRARTEFILPVILKDQAQTRLKQHRDKIISHIKDSVEAAECHGVWVVDCSLDDQSGSHPLVTKGLPKLIDLHTELRASLPDSTIVLAGPYWGANLILWARGLVDNPAIGMGRGYRYYVPGGIIRQSKTRIALTPVRRLATANNHLKSWLAQAAKRLPRNSPEKSEFIKLEKSIAKYQREKELAHHQVAEFYKLWIERLEEIPPPGRALALYQDLSSAFVVGKQLPSLPITTSTPSRPEKVVQQLMLNCL